MVKVDCLRNLLLPCFGFSALYVLCAYTETLDPACQPGIPQQWYWHGTVRQGSVRFNLRVKTGQLFLSCYILFIYARWYQ